MMQSHPTSELAVLLVDDEKQTLKYFERAFSRDFTVLTAASADEAEAIIDADPSKVGVLISDQRMPGRTGVSLLNSVRRKHPTIVRMLTTAYSELDDAIDAVNSGEIFRYIVKPWDFDLLRQEMNTAFLVHSLQSERDLLVGEKLHVRQRMVAVDRARDLAVIAAAIPDLTGIESAVSDYVRDSVQNAVEPPPAPAAQSGDLWSLPQSEANHMSIAARAAADVAARMRDGGPAAIGQALTAAVSEVSPVSANAGVKIGSSSAAASGTVNASVTLVTEAIASILSAVAMACAEGGTVQVNCQDGAKVNGTTGTAIELTAPASGKPLESLLYGPPTDLEQVQIARLFAGYVAARAIGGVVSMKRSGDTLTARIELPGDPASAASAQPPANWLEQLFQNFENWPG